ncbi:hypothetical protein PM082_007196 [Marasmius tenuissimus]|nr:hypothetical protein PM082_007196 [Marasmius tenuissimus]
MVLKELSKPLQLLRDVKSRWSFTYLMLKGLVYLKDVVDNFTQKHSIQELHEVLNPDYRIYGPLYRAAYMLQSFHYDLCYS